MASRALWSSRGPAWAKRTFRSRGRRRHLAGQDHPAIDHQGGKGPHVVVFKQRRGSDVLEIGENGVGRQDIHHLLIKMLAAGAAQSQDLDFQAGGGLRLRSLSPKALKFPPESPAIIVPGAGRIGSCAWPPGGAVPPGPPPVIPRTGTTTP